MFFAHHLAVANLFFKCTNPVIVRFNATCNTVNTITLIVTQCNFDTVGRELSFAMLLLRLAPSNTWKRITLCEFLRNRLRVNGEVNSSVFHSKYQSIILLTIIHHVLNHEQVEIYYLYITSCLFPVMLSGVNGRSVTLSSKQMLQMALERKRNKFS